jgi:hypothetical protein
MGNDNEKQKYLEELEQLMKKNNLYGSMLHGALERGILTGNITTSSIDNRVKFVGKRKLENLFKRYLTEFPDVKIY